MSAGFSVGKCVEYAQVDSLFNNPAHPYTKALLDAVPKPDPNMRNRQSEIISGEVTSPVNPKPGCRFAARCPMAKPECTQADPKLRKIAPGHFTECIIFSEAPKK